jgi:hypothetical protein
MAMNVFRRLRVGCSAMSVPARFRTSNLARVEAAKLLWPERALHKGGIDKKPHCIR